ncbi:non-ribosomal peptide synthetase [Exiguobacterium sp. BMC-KP]|uniref:non-ribosomal peptide synthetase n=1 Tax=Exiguobacterium sp. BMC-KP TaxID=1684312 RepID=UPI0006AA5A18|nr:non-ribosomal peptide synthetase [Exiguobacterium sp. BMC-KP]
MIIEKDYLAEYNNTMTKYFPTKIHEVLANASRKFGEYIAIKDSAEQITYNELYSRASSLAQKISGTSQPVAFMAHREIETIIQMYAILISGNYFIPIDPDSPSAKTEHVLEHANVRYLLDGHSMKELHADEVTVPFHEKLEAGDDIAYVMFTSGSTGVPKGVVESHYQVMNTLFDMKNRMELDTQDGFLCLASFCFDLSIFDIFGAALSGGTLYLVRDQRDFDEVQSVMEHNKITVWNSVPSVMEYFLREVVLSQDAKNNLKVCLMSGDFVSKEVATRVLQNFSAAKVYSLGGATECSIWSILYEINQANINDYSFIPYGYPMKNQTVWILTDEYTLQEFGSEGQIAIGGNGVALGYLNDHKKTKETFIYHETLGYLYLTGDIGQFVSPHHVKFIGRQDSRAKVNGYRVSLNQIANQFQKVFDFKTKVLLMKQEDSKDKIVLVYEKDVPLDNTEIKNHLSASLALYELPNVIFNISEFPLTSNGKIDSKKLLDLAAERHGFMTDTSDSDHLTGLPSEFRTMLIDVLSLNTISEKDSLFDLGVDSIQLVKIKNWIEENEGIVLSLVDIYTLDEVEKIEEKIYGKLLAKDAKQHGF